MYRILTDRLMALHGVLNFTGAVACKGKSNNGIKDSVERMVLISDTFYIQSNFDGSNLFGTVKICSRQRLFKPRKVTVGASPGGIMDIIVGYLFGVIYFKCMLCERIRIAS